MTLLKRIWSHVVVLLSARRNKADLARLLLRRPQWGVAVATAEASLLAMGRVDPRLKALATAKAAMIVNCEFCLDLGASLARREGLSDEQLAALVDVENSAVLTEVEKLVVRWSAALSTAPVVVPDELQSELTRTFTTAQLTELAAEIAWENQRARFNQAMGVRSAGYSDGAFCLIPEPV